MGEGRAGGKKPPDSHAPAEIICRSSDARENDVRVDLHRDVAYIEDGDACIILFHCQPKVLLEVCESRRSNIMSIKKVQDVNQTKDRHEPDVDLANNDTLK